MCVCIGQWQGNAEVSVLLGVNTAGVLFFQQNIRHKLW